MQFLFHDIPIYMQAVSVFCSGFKSKNNRAILELILKFLTGEKGGRVLSTLLARMKSEAMCSVHRSSKQKVKQCIQYIRSPGKKWSCVFSTLATRKKSEAMYFVQRGDTNRYAEFLSSFTQ